MKRVTAALAASVLLVAGCSSGEADPSEEPEVTLSPTATTTTATQSWEGLDQPLDPRVRPIVPRTIRTAATEQASFGLVGVYRVAPDVVAVTGVLTPGAAWDPGLLAEAGFSTPDAPDFSAVQVTVAGDPRTFLPLRTERGHCLCSPLRAVDAATAVHVLVGIPEEAQTVTLRIADLGSLTDVAVTDLPDEQQRSGLGAGHNIEIQHVRRTGRQVVAEIRIENPSDASHRLPRGQFDPVSIAEPGPCFRSLTVLSADGRTAGIASEEGCQRGFLPAAHRFVDLTVTLGDPGGGPVTFLPSLGVPLRGRLPGSGQAATRNVIVGLDRYGLGELEVMEAPALRIQVPLAALFAGPAGDETAPSDPPLVDTAAAVLDSVADVARTREARRMTVTVHDFGAGTSGERMARSREQAQLLVTELAGRLGDAAESAASWVVTGTGMGSTVPFMAPRADGRSDEELAGLNSRVEIRVEPAP